MFEKLNGYVKRYKENVSVYVEDLKSGSVYENNAGRSMKSASVVKIFIMWEYYKRVAAGTLDPQSIYCLKDSDREGTTPYNTGILRDFHTGIALTLEDIVRMNIVLSDDTAANILLRMFGLESIQADIKELGLSGTRFDRIMNDYQGAREGRENYTSCQDVANFYKELLFGSRLPRNLCDEMLRILKEQRYTYGLPALLHEDRPVAHKTGGITEFGTMHDLGVICEMDGTPRLICCVMTQFEEHIPQFQPFALDIISRIAFMASEEVFDNP